MGWQASAARAEYRGAGGCLWSLSGGGVVRQGAASVRARCRADGEPARRLAPQQSAGAVPRQRCLSRYTDRSADRRADRYTDPSVRARALRGPRSRGGRASAACAMAPPWTMVAWARGPRDQATLPSQRRRDRSVDSGAARCPWHTAQTHATAVGHQRVASGWQPRRGAPCAAPGADCGGWDRARARVAPPGCPHGLGKRGRTDSRTAAIRGVWAGCLLGKHREAMRGARRP
jgi:hypothetical protein